MRLDQAIMTYKPFRRSGSEEYSQYFKPKTGPHANLVDCDYFIHGFTIYKDNMEYCFGLFSTSIDLYADDILADDWEVYEKK